MPQIDSVSKVIVYKACIVAMWSDNNMAVDEKRYLAYLSEALASNEEERKTFLSMRSVDFDSSEVLDEVRSLDEEKKLIVFKKCLEVLTCDHRITRHELQFLQSLRKACGIGIFKYRRFYNEAVRQNTVRLSFKYKVLVVFYITIALLMIGLLALNENMEYTTLSPVTECSEEEIEIEVQNSMSPPNTSNGGRDVYEIIRKGIVSINVLEGERKIAGGSGFVLGTDKSGLTYIITNKHVVEHEVLRCGFKGGKIHFEVVPFMKARFDAVLDYCSEEYDLAILSVKDLKEYVTPVKLCLKKDLRVGQDVYALGSPLGLKDSLTKGVISALRDDNLQTDATTSYGSSGGPLVDQNGVLCAVIYGGYRSTNFNCGIYTDAVLEMLEKREQYMKKKQ